VTVRFLADENLDTDIIQGLRVREPVIDILDVKTAGLRGTGDPALLELAAQQDRVLITYDRNTMTRHFRDRLDAGKPSPGVFILSPTGERHRRDHRVAASGVGGISSGRVAESDCLSAIPVNGESVLKKASGGGSISS